MKVAHIGGFPTVTESLIASLCGRGIDAVHIPLSDVSSFLQDYTDPSQTLLHIHGFDAYKACAERAKELGRGVILDLSSPLSYCHEQMASIHTTIIEGTAAHPLSVLNSHLWSSLGGVTDEPSFFQSSVVATVNSIPYHGPSEPTAQRVRVLHIPYNSSSASFRSVKEALESTDLKFDLSIMELDGVSCANTFYNAIKECDLFVEDLSLAFYGPLAVAALAIGKTVLGAAPQNNGTAAASLCPVLDTNIESLPKRLASIIREPRCLRDLGTRSRQFALSHHNTELVTNDLIRHYEKFTSRTLTSENITAKKGQHAPL